MRSPFLALVSCLALGLAASPASAQNLLANGAFESDLNGWAVINDGSNVATQWDSRDAGGSPSSGSVSVTNLTPDSGVLFDGVFQCLEIVPGGRYRLRGDVLLPSGQSADGWGEISAFYHRDEDCRGFISATSLTTQERGSWQQLLMDETVPSDARSVRISLGVNKQVAGDSLQALFDRVFFLFQSAPPCVANDSTLCLNDGRFKVTASWTRPSSETGQGTAIPLTQDTGYFWFFRDTNVEMIVKVLSGCSNNNHFWVFAGGLTNVGVELRVEDSETGQTQSYFNPVGEPFQPTQDTFAFATCP